MADGEVFEGDGEGSVKFTEDLFDEMQRSLMQLVKTYEINDTDLQGLLSVITEFWEMLDKTNATCEKLVDQKKDLEEIWNEEKEKRRQTEKRKTELENRFDEERYQWQSERQELQRDRVGLSTRIKQLEGRNKDLNNVLETQSEKYEQDQKLRNDLMEEYKKQYEIAKTSTLKRKKNKKQTPGYHDYSSGGSEHASTSGNTLNKSPAHQVGGADSTPNELLDSVEVGAGSQVVTDNVSPRQRRQLPSKNTVSLRTELKHPKGSKHQPIQGPEEGYSYLSEEERYYEIETREELLTSGPELLVVPTVAEVEMLKREQEESKRAMVELQKRTDTYREEYEVLESENALLAMDVEQLKQIVAEHQQELALLRQERDEILETYLDQPFDVYCVTKKELHEVLKKLHDTQIKMQKQSEEKQTLEMQLLARRRKKTPWKKFTRRFKSIFHNNNSNSKSKSNEEYEILPEPAITSYNIPPESPFSPKSPQTIRAMENFHVSRGWLMSQNGPTLSALPSLYCQVMLKEYHVTDAISCMCLARVYHSTQPLTKRTSLLPLAARTSRGRLCAEVWVGTNEGQTTFLEVIDVLSKRVVDRFLVRGNKIVCMDAVPGTLILSKSRLSSSSSRKDSTSRKSAHQSNTKQLFEESVDLFANDDEELTRQESGYGRGRKDSEGTSESDLRHYYKSRVMGMRSEDLERRKVEVSTSGSVCSSDSGKLGGPLGDATPPINRGESPRGSLPGSTPPTYKGESPRGSLPGSTPPTYKGKSPRGSLPSSTPPTYKGESPRGPLGSSTPPANSLASELLSVNNPSENALIYNPTDPIPRHSLPEGAGLEDSQEDGSSVGVYTDDEGDGWQTSTPLKGDAHSAGNEKMYIWLSPDTCCIHIYNAIERIHTPITTLTPPSQPSCIRYLPGKVCVGLCDSRMIIYHQETIVSGGAWDLENPSYIELPKLIPENPLPVRDIKLIRKKIWVTTGSFLTLLDSELLTSQGSKFLDANQSQPNKLLPLEEVVLVSTVKGSNIFMLDPERAEVLKRINISPASLILDNLLQLKSVNVTNLVKDDNNLFITTSTGKIFALPLTCFSVNSKDKDRFVKQASMPDPNDVSSASYPPLNGDMDHPLFRCTASSLLTHREGSIKGLVHIPLPEDISMPRLSNSNVNLSSRSLGLLSASSMPSLVSDSPPMSRSMFGGGGGGNLTHPVFNSLLVSCGKGYTDYLSDSSVYEGSTAIREKNEAFQVMVWGYEKSSTYDVGVSEAAEHECS